MSVLLEAKLWVILGQRTWLQMHPSLSRLGRWGPFPLSHVLAPHRYRRGSWPMATTGWSWWCCFVARMTTRCRMRLRGPWPCWQQRIRNCASRWLKWWEQALGNSSPRPRCPGWPSAGEAGPRGTPSPPPGYPFLPTEEGKVYAATSTLLMWIP